MKLFKNKKGDVGGSTQQVMFAIAEFIVALAVLVLALQLMTSMSRNADAQIITNDLVFVIKAAAINPHTTYFSYVGDLSESSLDIKENELTLRINRGSYTSLLKVPEGIIVESRRFFQPESLPIIIMGNELRFGEEGFKGIICEEHQKFPIGQEVFIEIESRNNNEKRKLEELKKGLFLLYNPDVSSVTDNLKLVRTKTSDSITIKISLNDDRNMSIIVDETKLGHEAFACYSQSLLLPELRLLTNLETEKKETEIIEIKLPSEKALEIYLTEQIFRQRRELLNIKTEIDLMQIFAKIIFEDILLKTVPQ